MRNRSIVLMAVLLLMFGNLAYAQDDANCTELDSAGAYASRADTNENIGDLEAAIADYTCAIQLMPDNASYYVSRGNVYYDLDLYDRALEDQEMAIELNPSLSAPYNNRGNVYYVRGDYESAVEQYTTAIELGGQEIPHYNRGNAYQEMGEYDLALTDLTEAIILNSQYASSYLSRAWVYLVLGDTELSHADFYRWITLSRTDLIEEALATALESDTLEMSEGRVYRLSFSGEAGQEFSAAALTESGQNLDPLLVLLNSEDEPITSDDDSGVNLDSVISNFVLPETGDYTLVLSHAGAGSEGNIRLSVTVDNTFVVENDVESEADFTTYNLFVNDRAEVYTTEGDRLNVRSGPGLDFEIVDRLQPGDLVDLLEGPRKADGLAWWRIRTPNGIEGWSVERVDEEQTLQLALLAGEGAIITSGEDLLNIRAEPTVGGELLIQLEDGTMVELLDVPTIADGFRWWPIRTEDGLEGWTVDRVEGERMLVPARERR